MPVDFEMLLSAANHPLFPFTGDRFTNDYKNATCNGSLALERDHFLLRSHSKEIGFVNYDNDCKPKSEDQSLFGTRKKKVSFADDRGLDLVEIREIPGLPHAVPKWSDDVLSLLMGGTRPNVGLQKKWKFAYEHPPWNDEELVLQLEKNRVVLESVTVDDANNVLFGKIKVKNLAYQKNVFMRVTYDRWFSFCDVKAIYSKPKKVPASPCVYDTFVFNTRIPPSAARYNVIEFCICFCCIGDEYWDNNGGINYRLTAVMESPKAAPTEMARFEDEPSNTKLTLSVTANFDDLSEMKAWNSFVCSPPYW